MGIGVTTDTGFPIRSRSPGKKNRVTLNQFDFFIQLGGRYTSCQSRRGSPSQPLRVAEIQVAFFFGAGSGWARTLVRQSAKVHLKNVTNDLREVPDIFVLLTLHTVNTPPQFAAVLGAQERELHSSSRLVLAP